jgi:hypothetical protein
MTPIHVYMMRDDRIVVIKEKYSPAELALLSPIAHDF